MTQPRLRPASPPGQDGLIGEYSPRYSVRLTMHRIAPGKAVVRRHRVKASIRPDDIATVTYSMKNVEITWDEHHRDAGLDWQPGAVTWIHEVVASLRGAS